MSNIVFFTKQPRGRAGYKKIAINGKDTILTTTVYPLNRLLRFICKHSKLLIRVEIIEGGETARAFGCALNPMEIADFYSMDRPYFE